MPIPPKENITKQTVRMIADRIEKMMIIFFLYLLIFDFIEFDVLDIQLFACFACFFIDTNTVFMLF